MKTQILVLIIIGIALFGIVGADIVFTGKIGESLTSNEREILQNGMEKDGDLVLIFGDMEFTDTNVYSIISLEGDSGFTMRWGEALQYCEDWNYGICEKYHIYTQLELEALRDIWSDEKLTQYAQGLIQNKDKVIGSGSKEVVI